MQLKPVKIKKELGFPTINEFARNPYLLYKNIPSSWLKNKYVAASLAMFVLCGNAGNADNIKNKSLIDICKSIESIEVYESNQKEVPDNNIKKIAPLFASAQSYSVSPCIAITPPVYLSESDALEIILEAFKEEDLIFETENTPEIKYILDTENREVTNKLDGYNKEYNIAFEFISSSDKKDISIYRSEIKFLKEEFQKNGFNNIGIFYDKGTQSFEDIDGWDDLDELSKKESKLKLVKQVQDFIQWLKDEGILKK